MAIANDPLDKIIENWMSITGDALAIDIDETFQSIGKEIFLLLVQRNQWKIVNLLAAQGINSQVEVLQFFVNSHAEDGTELSKRITIGQTLHEYCELKGLYPGDAARKLKLLDSDTSTSTPVDLLLKRIQDLLGLAPSAADAALAGTLGLMLPALPVMARTEIAREFDVFDLTGKYRKQGKLTESAYPVDALNLIFGSGVLPSQLPELMGLVAGLAKEEQLDCAVVVEQFVPVIMSELSRKNLLQARSSKPVSWLQRLMRWR